MNRKYPTWCIPSLILLVLLTGCASSDKKELYEAEKQLFKARKLNDELVVATMNPEFLKRTIEAYRQIIESYRDEAGKIDGMEMIVVSAQMELAELEFRGQMLNEARNDFKLVMEIAANFPAARANALWSAGFISQQMEDMDEALSLYEKFVDDFLGPENASKTARMNRRYLITPIRIAGIHSQRGEEGEANRWFDESEKLFDHLISTDGDTSIVKESHYNLLTTFLQGKRWEKALGEIESMKKKYPSPADARALLFLEARVQLDGFNSPSRAVSVLEKIIEDYPESTEALSSLLMAGSIHFMSREFEKARELFDRVIEEYPDAAAQNAEATWQLAQIAEEEGNWLEASLHYKSVYTQFPGTVQGMEAPLRITRHFREIGENTAMEGAYRRAFELYEKLMSEQYNEGIRIMAEEYYIRALTEQERWDEAAARLLALPSRYPDYLRFRENYLMAASIHENETGDREKAAEILQACIEKYPGTSIAEEADRQYKRIKGM